jgi:hypothetical protein
LRQVAHKEEERVEMEARLVYIFEFGITLEQFELADVEAEVQPRGRDQNPHHCTDHDT